MFSALGNIFTPKPRHTQQSDTRQEIHRHDPEFERRQRKKDKKHEDALDQNGATVSVAALTEFLVDFVKTAGEKDTKPLNTTSTSPAPNDLARAEQNQIKPQKNSVKTSGTAAKAASAYQSVAASNAKSSILIETTDQQAQGPSLDLDAADIRVIYGLIEDLKELAKANIEYLHIEPAETFLASLVNAVKASKASIS